MNKQLIVDEARTWINTPYHHHAHVKGVGVDCAQLVYEVARNVGIVIHKELPDDYSQEWNIHNREERMLNYMEELGCRLTLTPAPGDIVAFKVGRAYGHVGILTSDNTFVHAFLQGNEQGSKNGFVTEVYMSGEWARLDKLYYTYPENT